MNLWGHEENVKITLSLALSLSVMAHLKSRCFQEAKFQGSQTSRDDLRCLNNACCSSSIFCDYIFLVFRNSAQGSEVKCFLQDPGPIERASY